MRFGREAGADVRAEQVRELHAGGFAFELVTPAGRVAARVAGLGEATLVNALAAAAAAQAAGATLEALAAGLARFEPAHGRLERIDLARGVVLIDDTYNANPQSMEVALRMLAQRRGHGRGLAVLGEMGELGATAPTAHRELGRLAAALGLDAALRARERTRSRSRDGAARGRHARRADLRLRRSRRARRPHRARDRTGGLGAREGLAQRAHGADRGAPRGAREGMNALPPALSLRVASSAAST